jgi:hypothetical protein
VTKAANLELCLAFTAFSSEGSPKCHTYCNTSLDIKVISGRPVILTSECHALDEGAITTYYNILGMTRLARVGLEHTTSWMLSESTTTRLPQPVSGWDEK